MFYQKTKFFNKKPNNYLAVFEVILKAVFNGGLRLVFLSYISIKYLFIFLYHLNS